MRSRVYGLKSTDCEAAYSSPRWCEPCEHTNYVFSQIPNFFGNQENLIALLTGVLATQEQFLQLLCDWVPEGCFLGELHGFPCIQCDYVIQREILLCEPDQFECNGETFRVINPCAEYGVDLCLEDVDLCRPCIMGAIDMSSSGESQTLYDNLLHALLNFDGAANWLGIEQFIQSAFGDDARIVKFENGTYFLYLGRPMTDFEKRSINIIKSVLPLPVGADAVFVEVA